MFRSVWRTHTQNINWLLSKNKLFVWMCVCLIQHANWQRSSSVNIVRINLCETIPPALEVWIALKIGFIDFIGRTIKTQDTHSEMCISVYIFPYNPEMVIDLKFRIYRLPLHKHTPQSTHIHRSHQSDAVRWR